MSDKVCWTCGNYAFGCFVDGTYNKNIEAGDTCDRWCPEGTVTAGRLFNEDTPPVLLTTGQMIDRLKIGQKAKVVANGYIGGVVYIYKSPITDYTEIRWEETDNAFWIGGFVFDTIWVIVNE